MTGIIKAYIEKISLDIGLPVEKLMEICLFVMLFFTLIGSLESLTIHLVGTVYPIFKSIEALESDSLGDDKLWLTYWIVFSMFILVD